MTNAELAAEGFTTREDEVRRMAAAAQARMATPEWIASFERGLRASERRCLLVLRLRPRTLLAESWTEEQRRAAAAFVVGTPAEPKRRRVS